MNSPKTDDYETCCLRDYISNIKYEDMLYYLIKSYFAEYQMILDKKYIQIIDKLNLNKKDK